MKRFALILSILGFATVGLAATQAKKTCGQMVADEAVLPSAIAELANAVAESQEAHARFMKATSDKAAKEEIKGLTELAKDHRAIAKELTATAKEMKDAVKWPGAPHDMNKLAADPSIKASNAKLLAALKKLDGLLKKEISQLEGTSLGANF